MRVNIVFGLLLVLFAGTGALWATRERVAHDAPAPARIEGVTDPLAPVAASASASGSAAGSASAPPEDAGAKLMDRPLRAVTLGWDLAAPAVLANAGLEGTAQPGERPGALADKSDFAAAGVATSIKPVDAMAAVEAALARGGADKDGADIAIVPFCELVASYERLRALSPEVFFVVGWSRGREALISSREALPTPDDKPKLKIPADPKSGVEMIGTAGETATFLGLFALDANGVAPASVRLVALGAKPEDAPLAAVDRDAQPDPTRAHILLTTADASRLIPFVAVAQHGLLEKNSKAVTAWARVWLEGTKKLEQEPAAAARTISGAQGAPEPIAMLKRLGEISLASLGDNTRAFGLSGRGALRLPVLFQETWRIWRAAGVLATPEPESAPINDQIVSSLVRSHPSLVTPAPPRASQGKAPANIDTLKALITFRQPEGKVDDGALLSQAGLLADIFERAPLRVAVVKAGAVDNAGTKKLVDDVVARFDVSPARIAGSKKAPAKAAGVVEILAAP